MSFVKFTPFGAIRIASAEDVRGYVVRTTSFCTILALACDVANQMIFFDTWGSSIRSWLITLAVVVMIAVPVSRSIAIAHLMLFQSARTDYLTGLANRRALFDEADSPKTVALIIADIDRFKAINDVYGHLIGDTVLKAVAVLMQDYLQQYGLVGRLGGEEFALICTENASSKLERQLEAFREAVQRYPIIAGDELTVSVTISIGVARRDTNQSFQELYAEADRALYIAKNAGRNRVVTGRAKI
ncbi:GGDEF domain-containing protein [Methylobacterium radiotolerans]|uniref:GGDEF domain-containing protein n=1 Tax=Methylobacterium radiotolerans TaxID=31998 RepID=UPI001F267C09|nr:GGDEF domain-containing protein [Methylobacterium radiotolerans]UIY43390.1 GGDEF domain-containing protein [Methylobacterium radiotolerans]